MIGIVMIVIGVFVSDERDREMRGSSAQGAEIDSLRCNSSFRESRTVKRNYSQLSGRTLNDPPPRIGISTTFLSIEYLYLLFKGIGNASFHCRCLLYQGIASILRTISRRTVQERDFDSGLPWSREERAAAPPPPQLGMP